MWNKIEDKLPELGFEILTFEGEYYPSGKGNGFEYAISIEYVTSFMLACLNGEEYSPSYNEITHWMPLPEPPGSDNE